MEESKEEAVVKENNPLNELIESIISLFKSSCEGILVPGLSENEYEFFENTIYATLSYLKSKRNHEKRINYHESIRKT